VTHTHLVVVCTRDGARFCLDRSEDAARMYTTQPRAPELSYDRARVTPCKLILLGRLRAYTAGSGTVEFLYDATALSENRDRSINDSASPLCLWAGVDEPLIWYAGAGVASGQNWLIADRQRSIIAATNSTGAATTYAYDPYGVPREWIGPGGAMLSRFRYTGQAALPELRLFHYKARVYDPGIGRFLQTDPIGYDDDLNLYGYVRNDALNAVEPTMKLRRRVELVWQQDAAAGVRFRSD